MKPKHIEDTSGGGTMTKKDETGKRAVSEVVGYVIVIGIIITSVGMVYSNAFPLFTDTQDRETFKNAEEFLSVLRGNFDDMTERGIQKRGTEVRLKDSALDIRDGSVENASMEIAGIFDTGAEIEPIAYETPQGELVYENGAVFVESESGAAMMKDPGWSFTEDSVVMSGVITQHATAQGTRRIEGDGIVFVRSRVLREVSKTVQESSHGTVRIDINSPRVEAWEAYFNQLDSRFDDSEVDFVSITVSGDDLTVRIDNYDRFIFTGTEIGTGLS